MHKKKHQTSNSMLMSLGVATQAAPVAAATATGALVAQGAVIVGGAIATGIAAKSAFSASALATAVAPPTLAVPVITATQTPGLLSVESLAEIKGYIVKLWATTRGKAVIVGASAVSSFATYKAYDLIINTLSPTDRAKFAKLKLAHDTSKEMTAECADLKEEELLGYAEAKRLMELLENTK